MGLCILYMTSNSHLHLGSYSNPASVSRCSLCNAIRPASQSSTKNDVSPETTVSPPSSVDFSGLGSLSQHSSKLFSIEVPKASGSKKTLGIRRASTLSQRTESVSRLSSLSIAMTNRLI